MRETSKAPPLRSRSTLGGIAGNILEWYDFAVFGYFAPIIGAEFFPSEDPIASTLKAFGVFAAGYCMRPVGGVLFGHFGDKLEPVAKPHRHFLNVIMTQASWKKATNILI